MDATGVAAGVQAPQTGKVLGYESPSNGGFLFPNTPNIVDFLDYLAVTVQIPSQALPATSPWPQYCLTQAIGMVLAPPVAAGVPGVSYSLTVYNCATHLLFTVTPDVAGQNWFTNWRQANAILKPSTGLVAATSDESTSATLSSPDWTKRMTVGQLGFYKTPWGRAYLDWQMSYGPNIVGVT